MLWTVPWCHVQNWHDAECVVYMYGYSSMMLWQDLIECWARHTWSPMLGFDIHLLYNDRAYVKYLPWRDVLDYAYVIAWKVPLSYHDVVCHDVVHIMMLCSVRCCSTQYHDRRSVLLCRFALNYEGLYSVLIARVMSLLSKFGVCVV